MVPEVIILSSNPIILGCVTFSFVPKVRSRVFNWVL